MAKDEKGEKKPILKAKEETIVDKVKVRGYWCYLTFLEILRYQYNGMNENYEKFIRYNKGYRNWLLHQKLISFVTRLSKDLQYFLFLHRQK